VIFSTAMIVRDGIVAIVSTRKKRSERSCVMIASRHRLSKGKNKYNIINGVCIAKAWT
jgi:hypothetical protein